MTNQRICQLALATSLLLAPFAAFAHATGVSYQAESGPYTVDVGYSTPAPQVGESVLFDFDLRKQTEPVPFSDAWVKVESAQGVVFASGIHNDPFGGARMSYVFPGPGSYTISVRYEKDANTIIESSFPITVLAPLTPWYKKEHVYVLAAAGIEAVVALGLLLYMRRRARS